MKIDAKRSESVIVEHVKRGIKEAAFHDAEIACKLNWF